jgi:hypothetical protein
MQIKHYTLGDILPGFINIILRFCKTELMNLAISSLHYYLANLLSTCQCILAPFSLLLRNNAKISLYMINKRVLASEKMNPCQLANSKEKYYVCVGAYFDIKIFLAVNVCRIYIYIYV